MNFKIIKDKCRLLTIEFNQRYFPQFSIRIIEMRK